MHRRTRRTLLIVAAVLVLLALAIFLRSKAPPEAARLLPESDGIVYINLKPFHTFFRKDLKPPQRVPEYQQFVDATGIDWERDLDQVAIGLHRMPDPNGPNGPVAYSMVLVGKITGQKLNTWLDTHTTARETYAGKTIYSIPSEGRTVRVAQIGYDMVAVTNTPTPEQIHSIIDRHRSAALPFAGSSLLEKHYHEVPLLSLAWGVGQIGLPFSESGAIKIFGFSLPLQDNSTIIASVAPALPVPGSLGALRLKVEEIAPTPDAAAGQAANLATLVTLARGFTAPLGDNAANNGLKELLKTAEVTQHRDRVVVTATLPAGFLARLAAGESTAPAETAQPDESQK
ncbi:MAG TPA: hypothetical protein VHD85_05140 [Terracidiphilus sp.]|jgi:hypothetical protein|nr:hypothetical protein [Terracidiphilus sp.]